MNGNSFFVDTNMLIMLVEGNDRVAELFDGCKIYTSFITEIELLGVQELQPIIRLKRLKLCYPIA